MVWVKSRVPDAEGKLTKEITYWQPDILPEPSEEWRKTQLCKKYLKDDGNIVSHPAWYYSNGALACDEYFYHNYNWLTIIDEKLESIHEDGNTYFFKESPINEWEVSGHNIKKKYKKYLYLKKDEPIWEFDKEIHNELQFNDDDLTVTDNYIVKSIPNCEQDYFNKIREIRNYLLQKTDYFILISKETGRELSQEFLTYRQSLRDCPGTIRLNTYNKTNLNRIKTLFNSLMENKLTVDEDISFLNIREFPTSIFK